MTSVETEALLKQLDVPAVKRVTALPALTHKKDMSQLTAEHDFDQSWDNPLFVKYPCSTRNSYRLKSDPTNYLSKWKLITDALSAEIKDTNSLQDCILSYSPTFVGQWTFGSLHEFGQVVGDKFWNVTLPFIAAQAKRLDQVFDAAIPLLPAQLNAEVTLTQEQCCVLLANMFFCTFPQRSSTSAHGGNGTGFYETFPNVNFNTLFATHANRNRPNRRVQKLQCIAHYFETLAEQGIPNGKVTIRRQILDDEPDPDPDSIHGEGTASSSLGADTSTSNQNKPKQIRVEPPNWSLSTSPLLPVDIHTSGTIEDHGDECWQVDFANMIIGGGVIGAGCVQEEIRFVINPECLIARLLCETLAPNEAVLIIGAQRYSNYTGYRDTFAWASHHEDKTARAADGRLRTIITAIDAVSFPPAQIYRQFSREYVLRELNKAYIGFMPNEADESKAWRIATGHWGCGAFNGDKHLKALIQWMAASETSRRLKYFSFGDQAFTEQFERVQGVAVKANLRVGDLWQLILSYRPGPGRSLFNWALHAFQCRNLPL